MGHSVSSLESATEKHPISILLEQLRTQETWKGTKSAQEPTLARCTMHRGAFWQLPFRWIYYCHSSKSTGKETGKTHLCAMVRFDEKLSSVNLPDNFWLNTRPTILYFLWYIRTILSEKGFIVWYLLKTRLCALHTDLKLKWKDKRAKNAGQAFSIFVPRYSVKHLIVSVSA